MQPATPVAADNQHAMQAKGMPPHMPATVLLKRRRKGKTANDTWEVVRAQGHLDEVQSLRTIPPSGADLLAAVLTQSLHTGCMFRFRIGGRIRGRDTGLSGCHLSAVLDIL